MQVHDVVALIRDVPESGLVKGQVGSIVDQWRDDVFEVEFADLDGKAYAFVALPENALMSLWFHPVKKAA